MVRTALLLGCVGFADAFAPMARPLFAKRQQVVTQFDVSLTDPLILAGGAGAAIAVTSPLWSGSLMKSEGESKG